MPLSSANLARRWPNVTAIEELKARLDRFGFRRVVGARVFDDLAELDVLLCGPLPSQGGDSVIAVVSEDAADDVDLSLVGQSTTRRDGDYRATEARPDLAAAALVPTESDRTLLRLKAWRKSPDDATRRWLVMEIAPADPEESDWTIVAPSREQEATARGFDFSGQTIAYLPMQGGIGLDPDDGIPFITAADFEAAVTQARNQGVETLLLHIDTPGGRGDTSSEIQKLMLIEQARGTRILAFLENQGGISAGGLIALGCEHWFITPGAQVGAAVGWSRDDEGHPTSRFKRYEDDPALLQKFLAIQSARSRECCEIYGRDPALAQAMIALEPELWWDAEHGFSGERPSTFALQLDTDETVLSLTAENVRTTGLGTKVADREACFERLGLEFDSVLDLSDTMQATYREYTALVEKRERGGLSAGEEERLTELLLRP